MREAANNTDPTTFCIESDFTNGAIEPRPGISLGPVMDCVQIGEDDKGKIIEFHDPTFETYGISSRELEDKKNILTEEDFGLYSDSLARIMAENQQDPMGDETYVKRVMREFSGFQNPYLAYSVTECMMDIDRLSTIYCLRTLALDTEETSELSLLSSEVANSFVATYEHFQAFATENDLDTDIDIDGLAQVLKTHHSTSEYVADFAQALQVISNTSFEDKNALADLIQTVRDPYDLALAWKVLHENIACQQLTPELRQTLLRWASMQADPCSYASATTYALRVLENDGKAIENLTRTEIHAKTNQILQGDAYLEMVSDEEAQCTSEITLAYEDMLQDFHNGDPDIGHRSLERIPSFEDLPLLSDLLKKIGINEKLAESMYLSWTTYDHLRSKEKDENPSNTDIMTASAEQANWIMKEVGALTAYSERYGQGELHRIISIFGVYNFTRCNTLQLHKQLLAWDYGEEKAKNICFTARTDWNKALKDSGRNAIETFGEDGFFYFEVDSPEDMARAAAAIGRRERQNEREPDVENVLIHAHGNRLGMSIGINNDLVVALFNEKTPPKPQRDHYNAVSRVSQYAARHLGKRFRVILLSCNAAAAFEDEDQRNISQALHHNHGWRVEGPEVKAKGRVIVDEDNGVFYKTLDASGNLVTVSSKVYDKAA